MGNRQDLKEVEKIIQRRINEILANNDKVHFNKLPGLIECLKIIRSL